MTKPLAVQRLRRFMAPFSPCPSVPADDRSGPERSAVRATSVQPLPSVSVIPPSATGDTEGVIIHGAQGARAATVLLLGGGAGHATGLG